MKFLLLAMFNLMGFFRALGLDTNPYSFGHGSFWKIIGPLGFFLGSLISGGDGEFGKVAYIIGIIFNIIILVTLFLI